MAAAPNSATGTAIVLMHKEGCATVWVMSAYDLTCARCSQINKVIQISRKTVANGASLEEAAVALTLAQTLITKYGLKRAECFDRLYAAPRNQPEARREEAVKRTETVRRKRRTRERPEL